MTEEAINEDVTNEESINETQETEKTAEEIEKEEYSKRVQKRIAKETWEKNELKRRIEALESELQNAKTPQIKTLQNGAPDPEQFPAGKYDPDYHEAIAEYKAQIAIDNYKKSVSNKQKEQEIANLAVEAQKSYGDYDEAISDFRDHQLSSVPAFNDLIMDSDNPIELAYYLGKNTDDLDKLSNMSLAQAARYIGKIEAQINTSNKTPPKAQISNAPAPLEPLKAAASKQTKDPEKMTMSEYAAYRKSQKK